MSSLKVKLDATAPDYGTLADDANTVHDPGAGKEPELAVSYHDIEYVVSISCGRKYKTVLNGVR